MGISRNATNLAVAASVLTSAASIALGENLGGSAVVLFVLGCSVSTLATSRAHLGETRRLIRWLGILGLLATLGFIVRGIHGELTGVEQPFPSPADLLHMPAYLLFFLISLAIARARESRSDTDAWLDAVAPVLAVFMLLWVSFLGDFVGTDQLTVVQRSLNMVYTTIILACSVVLLRIAATPGSRPRSYYLLGLAAGSYVVADLAATYSLTRGSGVSLTVALSPIAFGFLLASVKHPSITELLESTTENELRLGWLRLGTLGFTMLAPAWILLEGAQIMSGQRLVLLLSSVGLAGLVITRVLRLLVRQEQANDLEVQLTCELARLATLDRSIAIHAEVPLALRRLAGDGNTFATSPKDMRDPLKIPLERVAKGSVSTYWLDRGVVRPEFTRVVETLVRDARLLADSVDGIAASAKQESVAEANRLIAEKERRFRSLVQHASDIIAVVDRSGNITYVSDAMFTLLGVVPNEAAGRNVGDYIHPSDIQAAHRLFRSLLEDGTQKSGELRGRHANGSTLLFELTLTDMRNVPEVDGIVLNVSDVTDHRRLERDLKDAETTDALTLQLNRPAFIGELEIALRRSDVSSIPLSIAIIDLNDFKTMNDALGPVLADQALVEVADRIRRSVRIDDVVARLSGDEFGILMPQGFTSVETIAAVERALQAITEPFALEGRPVRLNATAGIAITVGDDDIQALELLRQADTALSIAKSKSRGRALVFEEEMGREVTERLELRNGFDNAMSNGELRLVYQPIICVETGRIKSLEALARWTHPTLGAVPPATFIPIAEESDRIHEIGEWALRSACQQLGDWERAGILGFTVSVNMSGYQLRDDETVDRVARILDETKVDPGRIVIEITESVLIDDTDFTRRRIEALRDLGVKLAIDDFGTGYSSLGYLQRYNFDILKIDKTFVEQLANDQNVRIREIVKSIISLARGLNAITVAEGIETEAEYSILQSLGCDNAQGFLFYRPMEVADATSALGQYANPQATRAA